MIVTDGVGLPDAPALGPRSCVVMVHVVAGNPAEVYVAVTVLEAFVVAGLGLTIPQSAGRGVPAKLKRMLSPTIGDPSTPLVTTTVRVDVVAPLPLMEVGFAENATALRACV